MAAASPAKPAVRRRDSGAPGTRFDRRLAKILAHATAVFYQKGYAGASMRDLSRASGMSLAGMYYYFKSKDRLLYLIQKHTFTTIMERLRQRLKHESDPEQRIRIFILNHLEYFLANQKAMTVLSHEDAVLKNNLGAEVAALKREYYRICLELMDSFKQAQDLEFSSRVAVLSLFGMMNWLYTWYNSRVDGGADKLAGQMGDTFLWGISSADRTRAASKPK
jgi:TetR/AcrR family transcriptional regulator, cholesterol catabolism regulator